MPQHKLSHRIFGAVASLVTHRPWWVIGIYTVLALLSVAITSAKLDLKTDQKYLVSVDLPYNQRFLKFNEEFGDLEFLYVVVLVNGQPERAREVVDAVAAEVSQLKDHVEAVFHRVPPESFGNSLLLLSRPGELEELSKTVKNNAATLQRFERVRSFPELIGFFKDSLDPALLDQSRQFGEWGLKILDASLESLASALLGKNPPPLESRLKEMAFRADTDPRRNGYLFSENGSLAFVEIMPKKDYETLEVIREPLNQIRSALDRVRARFPGVELGLTGRPVLQADEMKTTNDDMTISTVLALVLVTALTVFFFRRLRRPLLAVLALMVSVAITFGVVTVTLGYLTLLSIVFAVMIVGLGCDFGMLFLARYQEELITTGNVLDSTRATFLSSGMGIWTGGVTTACTFFSVLFVRFKGLAELGFVAGTGLMICLVTMLTLLPALILVTDRHIQRRRRLMPPRPIVIPFLEHAARHPRLTLAALVLLTAAGFCGFHGVPYNPNLLDLQVQDLESVRYEKLITSKTDKGTWYASFIAKSLEEVDKTTQQLREYQQSGIVGAVESIRDFVPVDQAEKLQILKPAFDIVSSLNLPSPAENCDSPALLSALDGLLDRLDQLQSLSAKSGSDDGREAVKALNGLIDRVEALRDLVRNDRGEVKERLARYQNRWFEELKALKGGLLAALQPERIVPGSLYPELRRRFVSGDEKKFLVYAYPKKNIWEKNNMEEFIQATTKVDPDVTGVPIHVYESERLMRDGFLQAALYALIMVFAFLFLDFRSLKYSLLTMTPVFVGILWAVELMPRLGLDINMANFFSLPILLGCAVDGCVHMLHRFRETGSTAEAGRTTGAAVCLAALSNMLGFASMGIARHRGVASLGMVTALGCTTILIASVILLPCLLAIFEERARRKPGVVEQRELDLEPVSAKSDFA